MTHRPRPIFCATDFSPSGQRAVALAAMASRALGQPLVLAHVMDTGRGGEGHPSAAVAEADRVLHERIRARVSEAQRALDDEAARHAREGGSIETALLDGRPWEAIVSSADAIDASLIVVGAHGASEPARVVRDATLGWLLGSTADRVVRASHRPVLVTPREGELSTLEGTRWIAGIGLDEASKHALVVALELAQRAAAHVEVVHVTGGSDDGASEARRATESSLAALVRDAAAAAGVAQAPSAALLHGDPASAIVGAASNGGALVIVGTQARGPFARAILGSVAERVLRTATTPVLVVPPPSHADAPRAIG